MLDATSPVPLHHQLAQVLRREIAAGTYPPGTRLPTEHELCVRLGVSRTPVRKALGRLADEGVIVRYRRRGSFVTDAHQPTGDLDVVETAGSTREWHDLVRRITAGRAPDAAIVPAQWVASLAALGAIVPTGVDADPLEVLAVPDSVAATWELGDDTYAIPLSVELYGLWLRRSALDALGDRPPLTWADLRAVAVAARDLDGEVSSPLVLCGGSAAGEAVVMTAWLLLASAGIGLAGAGPSTVAASGRGVFTYLRRMIDTGLMSPDVVGYVPDDVTAALLSGRAVAGVGPSGTVANDDRFVFTGFPGSGTGGGEVATLADCRVGVIMSQSERQAGAGHLLAQRRRLRPLDAALSATAHAPPTTPHHIPFGVVTATLMDDVISGRSTVDAAITRFAVATEVLGG